MVQRSFLERSTAIAFAHRGGGGEAPENTLPAFEAAVAMGYRYLETDVHLTNDGVLLAFHDSSLERLTDRAGPHRGAVARRGSRGGRRLRIQP